MPLSPFQPLTDDRQGQASSLRALWRKLKAADRLKTLEGALVAGDVVAKVNDLVRWARSITTTEDFHSDATADADVSGVDGTFSSLTTGSLTATSGTITGLSAGTATFGGATNYSGFEADGTLKFTGGATVWDDSMTPAFGARTAAADLALQVLAGGIYAPRYDLNDEIFQCVQFPHSIKTSGTVTIKAHVHLVNKNSIGATGYNVAFDLEYLWGNIGSTLSGSSQSDKRVSFQNANALTHKLLAFDDITAGAGQGGISSLFFCRLKRVAAGAEPYNTNDVFFGGFDIHFEKDTVGSREPASK